MPQPALPLRHVFVYGTLRAGGSNDIRRYLPAPIRVGVATVPGTLYDLGPYPGLRLEGGHPVAGEVYAVAPAVERELDCLEEVREDDSGEYLRREIDVVVAGRALRCLVYEIQADRVRGRPVIAAGDWLAHLVSRAGK